MKPLSVLGHNASNYLLRSVPSPLILLVIAGASSLGFNANITNTKAADTGEFARLAGYAIVWFLIFIAPVLGIGSRSELYLYLPGFGMCLLAGRIADHLWERSRSSTSLVAALCLYVSLLAGYQLVRSHQIHEDSKFSAQLLPRLRSALDGYTGPVVIVPGSPVAAQFLLDSVGGYGDLVLKMATGRNEVNGMVLYGREVSPLGALHIRCDYVNGELQLVKL
jgi:hypothetical protein